MDEKIGSKPLTQESKPFEDLAKVHVDCFRPSRRESRPAHLAQPPKKLNWRLLLFGPPSPPNFKRRRWENEWVVANLFGGKNVKTS